MNYEEAEFIETNDAPRVNLKDIIGEDAEKIWIVISGQIFAILAAWNSIKYLMDTRIEARKLDQNDFPTYLKKNNAFLEHFKGLSFFYIFMGIARLMDKETTGKKYNNSFKALHILIPRNNPNFTNLSEGESRYQALLESYLEIDSLYYELKIDKLRNQKLSHNDRDYLFNLDLPFERVSKLLDALFNYYRAFINIYENCDYSSFNNDYGIIELLDRLKQAENYRNVKFNLSHSSKENFEFRLKLKELEKSERHNEFFKVIQTPT